MAETVSLVGGSRSRRRAPAPTGAVINRSRSCTRSRQRSRWLLRVRFLPEDLGASPSPPSNFRPPSFLAPFVQPGSPRRKLLIGHPGFATGQRRSAVLCALRRSGVTSPYLLRPLRSYEEALRDIERAKETRAMARGSAAPSDRAASTQTDPNPTLENQSKQNEAPDERDLQSK
jgi:hypothetical protein